MTMADQAKAASANESEIGRDVLYVMKDGTTIRPAKIIQVEESPRGGEAPRAVLAIFTAGKLDRGLIEHHERAAYEGSGMEPGILQRAGVPYVGSPKDDGTWQPHSFHLPRAAPRVSATAPTERPPASEQHGPSEATTSPATPGAREKDGG
jgi:hypothetical protein